jgi:hypothetical protein
MVTSAHFSKENKVLLNKSQTPFFFGLPSGENLLEKNFGSHIRQPTIWTDASYLMFSIFLFDQNLTKLFYGWWQLKLSICKTGQKNPSAAKDETTPTSTPL